MARKRKTPVHRWTEEETEIICEEYIQNYLKNDNDMSVTEFIDELRKYSELDGISDRSLRMKVSNCKSLVEDLELGDKDAFSGGRLSHYSRMHEDVMLGILRK